MGKVGIVMGSDSDLPVMKEACAVLEQFGVPYEITVASAHRSPERAAEWARTAAERGLDAVIAGAGGAAHLAGVVAAHTTLPVIAVPLGKGLLVPAGPMKGCAGRAVRRASLTSGSAGLRRPVAMPEPASRVCARCCAGAERAGLSARALQDGGARRTSN